MMFRLRRHKTHTGILVGMFIIGGLLVTGMLSDTTYTFFSRANQDAEPVMITDVSQEVIEVAADQMPTCVHTMQYLPQRDDTRSSCFVQFTCSSEPSAAMASDHGCTVVEGLVTCDTPATCQGIDVWSRTAVEVCGCGE